ncbi:MAG: ATPase, partial [Rhodobacteraceae bacterium PARR1]
MDLFLGIDGGGTGCRAVLADASGHILGRGEAGPANIASDFTGALDNILAATRLACGTHDLTTLSAGLGLAGANAAGASDRLAQALPFARSAIETDAITAVRGALGAADGIVAAIGTGSVFAAQRGGQVRQIGGWGLVLGDEGSGAWIGRAILSAALRAVDGFHPMTPLLASLIETHGGTAGTVGFSLSARPGDFARLAPQVIDSADPAARAVMDHAITDVAAAI